MEKKYYTITEEFVEKVFNHASKALVGKIMKRFELFDDKNAIKKAVKELIYENYRDVKTLLKSFSYGVKFITPKDPSKDQ